MGKSVFAVFIMAVITAVLSIVARDCDVRSGANRGWVHSGEGSYYYDDEGEEYSGMKIMPDDGTKRYFDEDTHIMVTGEAEIEGKKYLFDADGIMLTGFQTVNGNKRYYSIDTGAMKTGWHKTDAGTYYFDEVTGNEVAGWNEIDGKKYYFSTDDGILAKGMFEDEEGQYYADPDTGEISSGLELIDGRNYCFDEDTGLMKKGWVDIDGDRYFFNRDTGEGAEGIIELDGARYGFISGMMIRNQRAMADSHLYYFDEDGKIVRELDGSKPCVALTYDDGPSMYTDSILDTFEEYGQKCTFFIVGDRISWNEDVTRRESEMGCEQGNHTYGHNRLTSLDAEGQKDALAKTDDELIRVTGNPSTCLRPPEGRWNDTLKEVCGCPIILWSVDSRDWESRDKDKICNMIIGKVKDGDIVLMHDLYQATADATTKIVPSLVNAGFQLVTVEELGLLKRGGLEDGVVYYSIEKPD